MASLRALECLVAVADAGSITEAARRLHSSQPAVSHQLAGLEREARTVLLRRGPRGVRLTPAGRAAVADARRAVEAARSAVRSARAVGEATGGVLRLAGGQSLTVTMLAPIMRDWHRRWPDVTITLRESVSINEMLGFVDAGEVDVALVPSPIPERFTTTAVFDEEIVLAAPLSHRLAQSPAVPLHDLDGAHLVHYARENGLSDWLDQSLARAGVRLEPVMRTAVSAAAPQLAAAGLGISIGPVSAISAGFPGAVRPFSPRWFRHVFAVTPSAVDPLAARFIDDLRGRGVQVPVDVQAQLTAHGTPADSA